MSQLGTILGQIRRWAADEGPVAEQHLRLALDQLHQAAPRRAPSLEREHVEIGRRIRAQVGRVRAALREHGTSSPRVHEVVRAGEQARWSDDAHLQALASSLYHRRLRAVLKHPVHAHERAHVVPWARGHRIDQLDAHPGWDMLIDETGSRFRAGDQGEHQGRWVGVLVPTDSDLPDVRHFHATSAAPHRRAHVFRDLLAHEVGVVGLTTEGVHVVDANGWLVGVLALVEWVLRLLPAPERGTPRLQVYIEQRGPIRPGRWDAAGAELLRQRTVRGVERDVHLELVVVPKDGHPWLAYADALAYQWHPSERDPGGLLRRSGLLRHGLLMGTEARPLARALDAAGGDTLLDAEEWAALLRLDDSAPHSAANARLQARAAAEPEVWDHFVELVSAHLDGKAVDLGLLALQEDWLQEVDPEYPRNRHVELEWHLLQLKEQNHLGVTAYALSRQLAAEADALRDEDPALACEVTLTRAVVGMNAFLFDAAEEIVRPWAEAEPAVPGLLHWARAWSTLGQLHAYREQHAEARAALERAMEAFGRLSDPRQARLERSQTAAYLAIATMDDPSSSGEVAREAVLTHAGLVLGGARELRDVVRATGHADRYLHHVLVRFLALYGNETERRDYARSLGGASTALGTGHPWPLIGLWRGQVLLSVGWESEGLAVIRAAVDLTADQGPTVELMGATLLGVLRRHQVDGLPGDDRRLARLRAALPAAAARVDLLEDPERFPSDAALVAAVLPFNFR